MAKSATAKTSTASANLPKGTEIPEHMKQLAGGYAETWKPENPGDMIMGNVSGEIREVEFKQGKKTQQRRVFELTTSDDRRFAIWESAALSELFEQVAEQGLGLEVFIRFDGLGKKKPGQNPPKLFTVATA